LRILICAFLFIITGTLQRSAAQTAHGDSSKTTKLYHPADDAAAEIAKAVAKAKAEKKHVLLQAGGNWCVWCYRFNAFVNTDSTLQQLLERNYVVYHLNFSPENYNKEVFTQLGFPQRFGFPVLVVLNAEGERIHTQNSALLEKGYGYDFDKVKSFLVDWAPSALNPVYYKND